MSSREAFQPQWFWDSVKYYPELPNSSGIYSLHAILGYLQTESVKSVSPPSWVWPGSEVNAVVSAGGLVSLHDMGLSWVCSLVFRDTTKPALALSSLCLHYPMGSTMLSITMSAKQKPLGFLKNQYRLLSYCTAALCPFPFAPWHA